MKQSLTNLAEFFAKIPDVKTAEAVLPNIFTPSELVELEQRLRIFEMLNANMPQRKIASKLGVSIGTVSRGSRVLKYEASDYLKKQSWRGQSKLWPGSLL
ncbi:transcriptional regulator [Candidatus Peregrinibacteria bacterium CG11_big_fil_rev_8_21_14_0_20_41_10]|nr:MAG: transcriptional regulator [Candidatus Peregrinibacteria bacterium CG11_big_fil_rev_8_21_14_0_20_41_10]PIZ75775.1 MAG: transcriptional regulator [Candidatus Peregrinibacteria bacterium CG_4_10_14_0_2_um_filter_41_8]PJC38429.1 MAG: transcriptional regulator [Candidatus Peregrinibacteria bacterium CG_4_9_14_0_2_um_filter_41_14]